MLLLQELAVAGVSQVQRPSFVMVVMVMLVRGVEKGRNVRGRGVVLMGDQGRLLSLSTHAMALRGLLFRSAILAGCRRGSLLLAVVGTWEQEWGYFAVNYLH